MTTATDIQPERVDIPQDTTPTLEPPVPTTGDYNPEYPGSTEEHPYGLKPDGSAYVRKPRGGPEPTRLPPGWAKASSGSTRSAIRGGMPASESQARAAAALLARANALLGFSVTMLGMPLTAGQLAEANEQFETQAYEALLTDPALCRKILSGGAMSGKVALILAYGMLGASIAPTAVMEIKAKREDNADAQE